MTAEVIPFPASRRPPQPPAPTLDPSPSPAAAEPRGHGPGRILYPLAVLWAWLASHPI